MINYNHVMFTMWKARNTKYYEVFHIGDNGDSENGPNPFKDSVELWKVEPGDSLDHHKQLFVDEVKREIEKASEETEDYYSHLTGPLELNLENMPMGFIVEETTKERYEAYLAFKEADAQLGPGGSLYMNEPYYRTDHFEN